MHPKLDELLALRDGEGAADVVRHVQRCETCRTELAGLRAMAVALEELPPLEIPGDVWPEIRRRIISRHRRSTRVRLALIAASVLAVATVTVVARFGAVGGDPIRPGIDETRLAVEYLSDASRELERVLRDPSLQSPVLSPWRAAMIVELEDRIALVDIALAQHADRDSLEREVVLWSDRVELLDALVAARGGDTRNFGVTYAVTRTQGSVQ